MEYQFNTDSQSLDLQSYLYASHYINGRMAHVRYKGRKDFRLNIDLEANQDPCG